tara:strand:- start:1142 stop:1801 length:660 start_codon:yes stop_codon:yes gene_type:complete
MVVKNKYLRDNIMKLKDLLKEGYRLGDMWSNDFDYKGMLQMGAKANVNMNEKNLQKLYDSFEDVNYHSENRHLGMAIDALKNGDKKTAAKFLKDFNKACLYTLKQMKEGKLNEKVKFKDRPYDYQLDYVANDLFNKDYRRLNSKQKDKVEYELDGYMEESINERLSSSTVKRMDGLHNVKAMKQMLVGAEVIVNDLVEEGFDEMEVLDYLIEKIKKSAF